VLTINRGQGRLGEAAPAMIQAGEDSESEEQTLGQREVVRFWTCLRYSQENHLMEWLCNMKERSQNKSETQNRTAISCYRAECRKDHGGVIGVWCHTQERR